MSSQNITLQLRQLVRSQLGAIMRNPIREDHVTCRTCTVPIEAHYEYCWRCHNDRRAARAAAVHGSAVRVADRVVPLTYAVRDYGRGSEQAYRDMWRYKDATTSQQRQVSPSWQRVALLITVFRIAHLDCLDRVARRPVTVVTSVPSLGAARTGRHPLVDLTRSFPQAWRRTTLTADPHVGSDRARDFDPSHFRLDHPEDVANQHVLLVEDTWVTGGHAQSASAAVIQGGAAEVSILVLARTLSADTPLTDAFLSDRVLPHEYDIDTCPVTGGTCAN